MPIGSGGSAARLCLFQVVTNRLDARPDVPAPALAGLLAVGFVQPHDLDDALESVDPARHVGLQVDQHRAVVRARRVELVQQVQSPGGCGG
jgi:hypothetical protein